MKWVWGKAMTELAYRRQMEELHHCINGDIVQGSSCGRGRGASH